MTKNRRCAESTAWRWFSAWIRLRDSSSCGVNKCFTCSTIKPWRELQAGHYKPQGWNKGIKFDERNTQPQCVSCNMYKGGNLSVYTERLIIKYGIDIFDQLALANKINPRLTESGFRELATKYRKLVNEKMKGKE